MLLPVSKGFPVDVLRTAVSVGVTRLAENRVQEAEPKVVALPDVEWHLVGSLQGNKARRALDTFAVIQSVDSTELAGRLDRLAQADGRTTRVLLQVNVDEDPSKAGFSPEVVEREIRPLAALPGLRLEGLMTVGRQVPSPEAARHTFAALRALSLRCRAIEPALGPELSMGMSADYEVAIEEGATIVRVGRAIFGDRPTADGMAQAIPPR
jgi:pyridoxal phosphate enzyme (YggS family)